MGRPKADLKYYSPFGDYAIPPAGPPDPAWLPVVPAEGLQTWSDLAIYALQLPIVGGKVSLFTNFYQPQLNSTFASFSSPTAAGLAAQALPTAIRGGIAIDGRAAWTWPNVTFTASGGGLPVQIWGYFVYCTDPFLGAPKLLWAQRLVDSFAFVAPGQQLQIPLSWSMGAC